MPRLGKFSVSKIAWDDALSVTRGSKFLVVATTKTGSEKASVMYIDFGGATGFTGFVDIVGRIKGTGTLVPIATIVSGSTVRASLSAPATGGDNLIIWAIGK